MTHCLLSLVMYVSLCFKQTTQVYCLSSPCASVFGPVERSLERSPVDGPGDMLAGNCEGHRNSMKVQDAHHFLLVCFYHVDGCRQALEGGNVARQAIEVVVSRQVKSSRCWAFVDRVERLVIALFGLLRRLELPRSASAKLPAF
jgi:hypothetical protein